MPDYRPDLEAVPERMRRLRIHNGLPTPYFVQWFEEDGSPAEALGGLGGGHRPDFRIMDQRVLVRCHNEKRCWVCGLPRGAYMTFVVGPMCAVNRISGEPPSHRECGEWSARNCPFLARPGAQRAERPKPDGVTAGAGIPLQRNPGVALAWTTRTYQVRKVPGGEHSNAGVLFAFGDPHEVTWWAKGRPATREEIEASIDTGLPALQDACEHDADPADSRLALAAQVARARELLPA